MYELTTSIVLADNSFISGRLSLVFMSQCDLHESFWSNKSMVYMIRQNKCVEVGDMEHLIVAAKYHDVSEEILVSSHQFTKFFN